MVKLGRRRNRHGKRLDKVSQPPHGGTKTCAWPADVSVGSFRGPTLPCSPFTAIRWTWGYTIFYFSLTRKRVVIVIGFLKNEFCRVFTNTWEKACMWLTFQAELRV